MEKIIEKFWRYLDDLAVEYNPCNNKEINFEVIFCYDFLDEMQLSKKQYDKCIAWFWKNTDKIEKYFWNQIEIIKKENEAWEDTKEYLNMTFGIY